MPCCRSKIAGLSSVRRLPRSSACQLCGGCSSTNMYHRCLQQSPRFKPASWNPAAHSLQARGEDWGLWASLRSKGKKRVCDVPSRRYERHVNKLRTRARTNVFWVLGLQTHSALGELTSVAAPRYGSTHECLLQAERCKLCQMDELLEVLLTECQATVKPSRRFYQRRFLRAGLQERFRRKMGKGCSLITACWST